MMAREPNATPPMEVPIIMPVSKFSKQKLFIDYGIGCYKNYLLDVYIFRDAILTAKNLWELADSS